MIDLVFASRKHHPHAALREVQPEHLTPRAKNEKGARRRLESEPMRIVDQVSMSAQTFRAQEIA